MFALSFSSKVTDVVKPVLVAGVLLVGAPLCAAPPVDQHYHDDRIVPQHETQDITLKGPVKSEGIESISTLAMVSLNQEIKSIDDVNQKVLRAREIAVAPGGKVAVHQHQGRPGIAYILEGEIWEYRAGVEKPTLHQVGTVAVENSGVTHWWHNKSEHPVRALVFDVVPNDL